MDVISNLSDLAMAVALDSWTRAIAPSFFSAVTPLVGLLKQRKRFHRRFLRKPGLVGCRLLEVLGSHMFQESNVDKVLFFWEGADDVSQVGLVTMPSNETCILHFKEFKLFGLIQISLSCHFTIISDELNNH